MQKSGQHDVPHFVLSAVHPFGDDAGQDGNTQGMVVNVGGQMIQLVQVIDDSAVVRHRSDRAADDRLGLGNRKMPVAAGFRKDRTRFLNDALVFLRKRIAPVEYGGNRLIVWVELVFVLDIDNRNIQKGKTRDMCFCQ